MVLQFCVRGSPALRGLGLSAGRACGQIRTPDLGGQATTKQMMDAIVAEI